MEICTSCFCEGEEKRSKYRKPLKIQLDNDTTRNVGMDKFSGDADSAQKDTGLFQMKKVTGERTYEGNLKTEVGIILLDYWMN